MKKKIRNTSNLKLNLLFNLEKKLQKERPEQCLFIAVVLQALLDASKPELKDEEYEITYERERARAWFFASVGVTCSDFLTVCDHAGVDSSDTRVFARHLLKSNKRARVRRKINLILRKDLPLKM
jgi:hypothetical protein